MDEMLFGPRTEFVVTLSKTWKPSLTIWTYWVFPTAPLVSGGAQLQPTPGKGIPSKLLRAAARLGATAFRVEELAEWRFWMTGSASSLCRCGIFGFSLASCSSFRSASLHGGSSRSGGETSFR